MKDSGCFIIEFLSFNFGLPGQLGSSPRAWHSVSSHIHLKSNWDSGLTLESLNSSACMGKWVPEAKLMPTWEFSAQSAVLHDCMPAYRTWTLAVDLASKKEKSQRKKAFQASHCFHNHNVAGFSREMEQFASFSSMVKTTFPGERLINWTIEPWSLQRLGPVCTKRKQKNNPEKGPPLKFATTTSCLEPQEEAHT